jgi:hypothetical protein
MTVERTVPLRFTGASQALETHTNLSAVRSDGTVLWVAGDETATVERLVADDDGWGAQESFALGDLVDLPGDADEEADVEGLARDGAFLWAVGSHSLRRKLIKDKHDGAKALDRLATGGGPGQPAGAAAPAARGGRRAAAAGPRVERTGSVQRAASFGSRGKDLRDLLEDDEHLAPFLPVPARTTASTSRASPSAETACCSACADRCCAAGPSSWSSGRTSTRTSPTACGCTSSTTAGRYRKHVLDLAGLGVRDLCPHGDDLLVLAGPTMDLDGPVHVFRWHGAMSVDAPTVVRGDALTRELDLPYGEGSDHAEGIGLLDDGRLLVVYDSPSPERLQDGAVLADVVRLG